MTEQDRLENLDKRLLLIKDKFDIAMDSVSNMNQVKLWGCSCSNEFDEIADCIKKAYYTLHILTHDEYERMDYMVDCYKKWLSEKQKIILNEMKNTEE